MNLMDIGWIDRVSRPDDDTELLAAAESVYDGWYVDSRIDWDDFIDRLEAQGFDMGDSMLGPQVKAVQKHIRAYRKLS